MPGGFEAEGEAGGDGLEDGGDDDALKGLGDEVWVHGFEVEGCGCELDVMFKLEHSTGLIMRCLFPSAFESPRRSIPES